MSARILVEVPDGVAQAAADEGLGVEAWTAAVLECAVRIATEERQGMPVPAANDLPDTDEARAWRLVLQRLDRALLREWRKVEQGTELQRQQARHRYLGLREARGAVVEAKLDRGRGAVATVLIQSGTLKRGDVMVAGAEWGRVRAMMNERGEQVDSAGPSTPVEVLGLSGVPMAGDEVVVVENDARAREVSEYRQRVERDKRTATAPRGTIDEMFGRIATGESKELPVVVKADVQGSLEAILAALDKFRNDEVSIRVLHGGVGGINESDVTLASSSGGFIVGFNVRAAAAARSQAQQDGVDIRYYSIIYELLDDMKAAVEGLLAPEQREKFIGNAEIREVFNITKVGKVAGCRITDGVVRRGSKVRLLRDDVVIHEGTLKTLKRFKDEVPEVQSGQECGMAFENYEDIRPGDVIEIFEREEVTRTLD